MRKSNVCLFIDETKLLCHVINYVTGREKDGVKQNKTKQKRNLFSAKTNGGICFGDKSLIS